MPSINAFRERHPQSTWQKLQTISIQLLCIALLTGVAAAQQDPRGSAFGQQNSSGAVVGQNLDVPPSPSSFFRTQQTQSSLPNAPSATTQSYKADDELTLGDRFQIYRKAIIRPYSLVGPALGAGVGQWENGPPEWGQGGAGYARRLASGVGRQLISETIRFGVAAADGEGPRYHRSQDSGVWNRARHAIAETFTSETASGRRIPAYSRFAGSYGAAFISNTWYPDSQATPGWALRRGSTALASSVGFHLFQEFVPRKFDRVLHIFEDSQAQP